MNNKEITPIIILFTLSLRFPSSFSSALVSYYLNFEFQRLIQIHNDWSLIREDRL
jgi:hypothetical protein